MKLEIVNKSYNEIPEYATEGSAGMDIRANLECTIAPGERLLVPTGLFMAIEHGYEGQIRPRSGNALKHGVTVLNTPGTIDSDYRGEVKILLMNASKFPFNIKIGDRIAQIVFAAVAKATPVEKDNVEELSSTERGSGGFGHTGTK